MKRTLRKNFETAYSLHDMNVIAIEAVGEDVILRTQSGMVKTTPPYSQPDGYIEFHNVQWDFCYIYLLGIDGNVGAFAGEKMFLKDFLEAHDTFGFSIMDESYGYNLTKYNGYIMFDRRHHECIIEIYHEGDMFFITNE